MTDRSTRVTQHVRAARRQVYRALLDPEAVRTWMVPDGMTSEVHEFDAREGGRFRISLTYDEPTGTGKSTAHTDTYHGQFTRLVPDQKVIETIEFESDDAAMRGEMTVTFFLRDAGGGTEVVGVHEDLPPGLSPADNETGWRMSLAKLAALVERGDADSDATTG
ncbi:MAG TPA: SRPBCC family protein [Gemmatimonadaceae bacterium]